MRRRSKDRLVATGVILIVVAGLFTAWKVTKAEWSVQEKVQRQNLQHKIDQLAYRVQRQIFEKGPYVDFKEVFPDLPICDTEQKINVGAVRGEHGKIIISGNTHGTGLMSSLVGMKQVEIEVIIVPRGYDYQGRQVIKLITYYPSGLWGEWGVYSSKEEQVLENTVWKL